MNLQKKVENIEKELKEIKKENEKIKDILFKVIDHLTNLNIEANEDDELQTLQNIENKIITMFNSNNINKKLLSNLLNKYIKIYEKYDPFNEMYHDDISENLGTGLSARINNILEKIENKNEFINEISDITQNLKNDSVFTDIMCNYLTYLKNEKEELSL